MNNRITKQLWLSLIGLAMLAIAVLSLLLSTMIEAWIFHYFGGIIAMLAFFGSGIAIFTEVKHLLRDSIKKTEGNQWIYQGFAVIAGSLAAFAISHELSLGPVVSASLVGLLSSLIWPEVSIAAYCGAFVGMTSDALFFNYLEVALAGLISSGVYLLTKDVYNGIGGKLGTIALIGTAVTCMSLSREFLVLPIANWQTNLVIMLVSMLAAPLTFYFNISRKHGPVLASAMVGMTAGLVLPALFPQLGRTLAVVAICASFAGMTNRDRCPNFWHILLTGFFTSVIFVYSTPLLGGAGGKLGTIAFGAVLATCGLRTLSGWVWKQKTG